MQAAFLCPDAAENADGVRRQEILKAACPRKNCL